MLQATLALSAITISFSTSSSFKCAHQNSHAVYDHAIRISHAAWKKLRMSSESTFSRPLSQRSKTSTSFKQSRRFRHTEKETSLLSQEANDHNYGNAQVHDDANSSTASSLRSLQSEDSDKGKISRRWLSIIALMILNIVIIVILCLSFAASTAIEEYAKKVMMFEPTNLFIDSFTKIKVRARIQEDFMLDESKVQKISVRNLDRARTWIAKAVKSKRSKIKMYLSKYDNLLIEIADVSSIMIDIKDDHTTHIDFLSNLAADNLKSIRHIVMNWIKDRIEHLSIRDVADVSLKFEIFDLETQSLISRIQWSVLQLFCDCLC